jgi:hypothetical protein
MTAFRRRQTSQDVLAHLVRVCVCVCVSCRAAAGGGAAILGGAIGIPLLFKQVKVWDATM